MDPITFGIAQAAGSGSDPVYVDDVFSTFLYTGTGSSNSPQSINIGIDMPTEGGLTWIKYREGAFGSGYYLYDTARTNASLNTANSNAQNTSDDRLDFTSTGFNVKNDGGDATNANGSKYVSWNFRKAPGFFDIVTYTGNNTANRQIAHSLGSAPGMIIVKDLDRATKWSIYHRSVGATKYLSFDESTPTDMIWTWYDTEPTSTHFTVGDDQWVNSNNVNYVAYLFAHDDQSFGKTENEPIIKCGTYTGSSSQEINIGFEPQWFLTKCTSRSGTGYGWSLIDNMRFPNQNLSPNATSGENGAQRTEFRPGGVKFTSTDSDINEGGETYVYMAIRRPNKPSVTAGTDVFHALSRQGTGSAASITGFGFSPDLVINKRTATSGDTAEWRDKIRGRNKILEGSGTGAEQGNANTSQDLVSFDQDGLSFGSAVYSQINYSSRTNIIWNFKRAPGFLDVVTWSGNGSANRAITHSLGVTPELLITKRRTSSDAWWTQYTGIFGTNTALRLNENNGLSNSVSAFSGTSAATSSVFYVGSDSSINATSNEYVAFLFSTLNGVSKVGSYTGTGNNIDINCGFDNGARFVMIKRTDLDSGGNSGGWYVWDYVGGIAAGNDSYVLLDDTGVPVTNTDYIDPLNAGFTVTSSSPAALNESGGNYIFLAIA